MNKPHMPTTNKILNIAEPTMDPMPGSVSLTKIVIREMKTSGVLLPIAMNVAPVTSWSKFSFLVI